ncbi:MAG: hypothetical protein PHC68_12195 [Syntrophorhabdaceae bacterium]|nr:hypothetical protein [Syntrophorhabdaceae bacterium]
MNIFLAILTYFAYIFIVTAYTLKIVKYLSLPTHLRWELYPVIHEEKYRYGGSYFEDLDWWTGARQRSFWRAIRYLLRDYLYLESYLKKRFSYWLVLYTSHIGFVLLIIFQILIIVGALLSLNDIEISQASTSVSGYLLHRLTQFIGPICFIAGAAGNIGLLIFRLIDNDLRPYTSPFMYFGYVFHIILSVSGLILWLYDASSFHQYREFWKGIFTLDPVSTNPALTCFIILMNLHLVYLPFTRAIHYITRLFGFFLIRWDDEPNIRGSKLEKRLIKLSDQRITWSAPHIQTGKKWSEQ